MDEHWEVYLTDEVDEWSCKLAATDAASYVRVNQAILVLASNGPAEGRPLVDRVHGSVLHNLKELRPGSSGQSELRLLFMFDPWRSAILLVAGDKAGDWAGWYDRNIPRAEKLYDTYLTQRRKEMGA
jgi:hypothetical protein